VIVHVGDRIYVAGLWGCGGVCQATAAPFERTIHIYRDDAPQYNCQAVHGERTGQDLVVEYKDGLPLSRELMENVAQFASGQHRLLVHCAAGRTRSPTLAIVAKVARGRLLEEAIGEVSCAIWNARRESINLCHEPLRDIHLWDEESR
jgi:protein-tyrosine phosphatase